MKTSEQKWVVVVTEGTGDDTVCQVVSPEFATKEEAEGWRDDFMTADADWIIDVCTEEEAAAVVTE